jgi:hypothetical protein
MIMVTLRNVIDIRTGQFYLLVKVQARKAKYFVPAEAEIEEA